MSIGDVELGVSAFSACMLYALIQRDQQVHAPFLSMNSDDYMDYELSFKADTAFCLFQTRGIPSTAISSSPSFIFPDKAAGPLGAIEHTASPKSLQQIFQSYSNDNETLFPRKSIILKNLWGDCVLY